MPDWLVVVPREVEGSRSHPPGTTGSAPETGTGRVRSALPMFQTVTVCGLSSLATPTAAGSKVRSGGSARSIRRTWLKPGSAMYMLPSPSMAIPLGVLSGAPIRIRPEVQAPPWRVFWMTGP